MISNIKIYPSKASKGAIVGSGTFVYNQALSIRFTVMKGSNGLFVSLPGRKAEKPDPKTGKPVWYSDVFCLEKDLKQKINDECVAAYKKEVGLDQGAVSGSEDQAPEQIPFG
jgi:DNA-binding cell septation regulator SpoVG